MEAIGLNIDTPGELLHGPLLITRLAPPPVRPGWVVRERLLTRLDACLEHRLTLLAAPAGFGKTTLLCAWVARALAAEEGMAAHPHIAWLSLDVADNDALLFWRYVAAAIQAAGVPIHQAQRLVDRSAPPPPLADLVIALTNDIAAAGRPLVLILDDYHLIEAEAVHRGLALLLEHVPPPAHLVVATRDDPPLALARRRARGELVELRAADLSFTLEEAAEFLRVSMGLDLPDEDVAALERRTEGWIAGLQLAALSLQRQTDRHAFITTFAGDDRYVMDYLLAEVLHQQPAPVQAFLLETALLEQLTADLCDAVTGRADSGELLAELDRANLFVVPLDNRRAWYRYHFLFGELLRHRLRGERSAEQIAALHRRARDWYQANDWPAEAIHHALAAADWPCAAALIEQHALPLLFRSESAQALSWMQALPAEFVQSRPRLAVIAAWALLMAQPGNAAPVEQKLRAAEQALQGCALEDPLREMVAHHVAAIRAFMGRVHSEDPQAALALSRQALADLPDQDLRLRGFLTMNLASSYLQLGKAEAALRAFAEAQQIGEANEDHYTALIALHRQAYILTKQGRLREAARICRAALRDIAEPAEQQGRPLPAAGALYNALGAVLLEWNDLEEAGRALRKGLELLALTGECRAQVRGYVMLARLKQAQGDLSGALDALDQARPLWRGADAYAEALRIQFLLSQAGANPAEVAVAQRWAQERQIALDDGERLPPIYLEEDWRYAEQLTLARLLIVQGDSGARKGGPALWSLLQFLAQQRRLAAAEGWNERAIELGLLEALAWQARGDLPPALTALGEPLALAEPEGYVRIFIDHGASLARLLHAAAAQGLFPDYVGRLLAAMPHQEPSPGPSAARGEQPGMVEPLTPRELEVLRLIAAGLSNQEIATRLTITPGTTKVHTSRIYGKLDVHSRTQAVRRAHELGLLPASPPPISQI